MSKEKDLVKVEALDIESSHIKVTPYAIEFEGNPSIEEWYDVLQKVNKVHSMIQFYLGDLVVFAESEITGWGETYKELMENTGYEYQTLAHYANVARRFSPEFREAIFSRAGKNTNLAFTHFKTVASLDDGHAIYFLEMVRDAGWSTRKIEEEKLRLSGPKETVEAEVEEIPDGWEAVKQGKFDRYVPAPEYQIGMDYHNSEKEHRTAAVQLYKFEIENLIEILEGNDDFLSLIDRLETALGGM